VWQQKAYRVGTEPSLVRLAAQLNQPAALLVTTRVKQTGKIE
jgi:hypothetical protein